jgi:hypothetical protein
VIELIKYLKTMKNIAFFSLSLGIVFYLIAPTVLIYFGIFDIFPFFEEYSEILFKINGGLYYSYIFIFYLIFYSIFSDQKNKLFEKDRRVLNNKKLPKLFYVVFIGLQLWSYYNLSDIAFKGYIGFENTESNEFKAIVCGINIVYSYFYAYYSLSNNSKQVKFFLFQLIVNSIVLLGVGSRIYVLTAIMAVLYTNFYCKAGQTNKSNLIAMTTVGALLIAGLIAIAVWRQNLDIQMDTLVYLLFAEPYFVWLSGGHTFVNADIGLIHFPYDFLINIVGILPSTLFPFKFELMSYISSIINVDSPEAYSPLGGTSIIHTMLINFGFIGIVPAFIFFSLFVRIIYKKTVNNYFYSAYFLIFCSIIPFIMFRESFFHILKNTIANAFLIPYIFLNLNFLIKSISYKSTLVHSPIKHDITDSVISTRAY